MTGTQKMILAVNVIGGVAVLGSYVYGIQTTSQASDKLWGGVPTSIRPLYGVSMLVAAAGYLAVLYALLLGRSQVALSQGYEGLLVAAVFAVILLPSSLWMSSTFAYLENPSASSWIAVRLLLFLVAAGSLALIVALVHLRPPTAGVAWTAAITGASLFAFHTLVLDALLWPYLFRQ